MEEVYRLFDRRCRTATALAKLAELRARLRRFGRLREVLKKLLSPGLEKALVFLDERLLGATSNAVERGNRRYRKMQKTVYRVRTRRAIEGRLALDLFTPLDRSPPGGFRVNASVHRQLNRRKRRILRRIENQPGVERHRPMMAASNIRYEIAERVRAHRTRRHRGHPPPGPEARAGRGHRPGPPPAQAAPAVLTRATTS